LPQNRGFEPGQALKQEFRIQRNGIRMSLRLAHGFLAIIIVGCFSGIAGADDSSTQLGSAFSAFSAANNPGSHANIRRGRSGEFIGCHSCGSEVE
jgi:hypothetical protein